jgi:hypothetical protein
LRPREPTATNCINEYLQTETVIRTGGREGT